MSRPSESVSSWIILHHFGFYHIPVILIWSLSIVLSLFKNFISSAWSLLVPHSVKVMHVLAACIFMKSATETVVLDACTYSLPTEVSLFYDVIHSQHLYHQWINSQCRNSHKLFMFWLDTASLCKNWFYKHETQMLWIYSTRELFRNIVAVTVACSLYELDCIPYL
jgi:hypothetical protein